MREQCLHLRVGGRVGGVQGYAHPFQIGHRFDAVCRAGHDAVRGQRSPDDADVLRSPVLVRELVDALEAEDVLVTQAADLRGVGTQRRQATHGRVGGDDAQSRTRRQRHPVRHAGQIRIRARGRAVRGEYQRVRQAAHFADLRFAAGQHKSSSGDRSDDRCRPGAHVRTLLQPDHGCSCAPAIVVDRSVEWTSAHRSGLPIYASLMIAQ